MKVQMSNITLV